MSLRTPSPRLGTFSRGFVSTFALDIGARIAGAVAALLLIRGLPTSEYAFVVIFLAAAQLVASAGAGGVRMLFIRFEAERVSRGRDEENGFAAALAAQSVAVVAAVALAWVGATALAVGGDATDRAIFAGLVLLMGLGQAANDLVVYREQAHLRFGRAGSLIVVRGVLMLATTLAVVTAGVTSGVAVALAIAVVVAGQGLALALAPLRRTWRGARRGARRMLASAEARWLTVYYVAAGGFATVDVLLVGALLDDRDVAAFGAAQRYFAVALGALPALIAVFRVRTAQVDIVDSMAQQRLMLRSWTRRIGVLAVIVTGALAIAAPFAIPLIDGGRYPLSVPIFELLLIAAVAKYLATPVTNILMSQRQFKALARLLAAALALNACGNLVAAPLFGVVGVTAVAVSVEVALSVATVLLVLSRFGRRPRHASALPGSPAVAP